MLVNGSDTGRAAAAVRLPTALLVAALTLTGCSGGATSGRPTAGIDLGGPAWELVSGTVGDLPLELPDGYRITLLVQSGELTGNAGCNDYGTSVRVVGNEVVVGSDIGATAQDCDPEVMVVESAYLSALPRVDTGSREGDRLELSGDRVRLVFAELDPVPVEGLVGTPWVLSELVRDDERSPARGEAARLLLRLDGTVSGGTGCRSLRGRHVESGDEVLLTSLSAEGDCTTGLQDQDSLVVEVLGDGFRADVAGDVLTLTSRGGAGLVYVRG